jgi:hypothetical protein
MAKQGGNITGATISHIKSELFPIWGQILHTQEMNSYVFCHFEYYNSNCLAKVRTESDQTCNRSMKYNFLW